MGGLVLVIDRAAGEGSAPEAPRAAAIVVDDGVIEGLRRAQIEALGRPPTAGELRAAVERWIDDELLVREARALGLGRGDPVVRARLAARMAELHRARVVPDAPDEAALRALYARHRDDYRLPTRLTLRQVFAAGAEGSARAAARARAEAALAEAKAGGVPAAIDPAPGGPLLRGRRPARLAELYGDAFVEGLEELPSGEWTLRPSPAGWHVLRVEGRASGRLLRFEEARDRLAARWVREQSAAAAQAAVEALRAGAVIEGWPRGE